MATQHRSVVGGIETHLRALLPHLARAGYEIAIVHKWPSAQQGDDICGELQNVTTWCSKDYPLEELQTLVDAWRPEVFYNHGMDDAHVEDALAARFPSVYYAHVYNGTCISGTKCQSAVPRPCDRVLGPACLMLYLPRRCGGRNPLTMVQRYHAQQQRKSALHAYQRLLVASNHMAAEYRRHGMPADRVHIVPLWSELVPDPAPPLPRANEGRVLYLGRIDRIKGWPELLAALQQAADRLSRPVTLTVAGDGPDRQAMEAAASGLKFPAQFLGWVGPQERGELLRCADVLALPSVWPEPFGLSGIEAACVGLPAFGFATGGIPDWLIPGVSGESAPGDPPSSAALADALVRLFADDAHWQRLREGAWRTAQAFTPERHMALLEPILREAAHND